MIRVLRDEEPFQRHRDHLARPNVTKKGVSPRAAKVASETNPDYSAAIETVRSAMVEYGRSSWRLAWALVDFRSIHEQLHPHDRLTGKQLASLLGIRLSPARIGQIVNTAKAFPREQVDESIDFKVYERARVFTQKEPRMTAEKRLELVKEHPTTAAIAKIKPAARTMGHNLIIRITSPSDYGSKIGGKVWLNGSQIKPPQELLNALREYATNLFADTEAKG